MKTKPKIHIKKGDQVIIISGKYKGHIGTVIQIFAKTGKIAIKNTNLKTKHCRPRQQGETGKIIKLEGPIHSSNVKHYKKE